jgi:hypothetical protein
MSVNVPPSPAEVEALAEEMVQLKAKVAEITLDATAKATTHIQRLEELKATATDWIRRFGSAHAEKSKLLHGVLYEIMGTFGMSTSIDAAAVEAFRLALVRAGQAKLLRSIFDKSVRFDLKPGYAEIIKGVKLKPRLLALYARCSVSTPKTPVITPRLKGQGERAA